MRPGIGALVLTGAAGTFSAGGDMKDGQPRGNGVTSGVARLEFAQKVLLRLTQAQIPTIAAVEGAAAGIGWSLALTCNCVVAAEDAFFFAPFAQRALPPDGGMVWHLIRAVGRFRATDILLGNHRLSGADALHAGLVTRTAPPGGAVDAAVALGTEFAAMSRDAVMLTLRLIRTSETVGLKDYLDNEFLAGALSLHNPGVAAARQRFTGPPAENRP